MKADEVGALREQTLGDGFEALCAAAADLRAAFDAGGRLLALGNGGSATDAMDAVADFAGPPPASGWPARPALDLTADTAIITAIANDIGTEAIFSRQVIAYGRRGDVLLALSTSGNSLSVLEALGEARRRGLRTIALVGYDGGPRRLRGPGRPRRRHALAAHPAHPGGAGDGLPRPAGARGVMTRRASGRVEGVVQGVGFRPYVYRLAREEGLAGYVLNDERGVLLDVEGDCEAVERFVARLPAEAPPLASIESVAWASLPPTGELRFRILESAHGGEPDAPVAADAATCAACLGELLDPADRRYRYPFVNCTDCGPRFTIVRGVPYDRPLTTMAGFAMCPACQAEYDDPGDRRFHAQPNACPVCGPTVRLGEAAGDDAMRLAAAALLDGEIVAVKGLGGYHLACRADDEQAVARLRARKHREDRPFALMVPRRRDGADARRAGRGRGAAAGRARAPDRARARGAPARPWRRRSPRAAASSA